jgi:hypothetical protein
MQKKKEQGTDSERIHHIKAQQKLQICAFCNLEKKGSGGRQESHYSNTLLSSSALTCLSSQQVQSRPSKYKRTLILGKSVLGSDSDLLARLSLDNQSNITLTARVKHVKQTFSAYLIASSHFIVIGFAGLAS